MLVLHHYFVVMIVECSLNVVLNLSLRSGGNIILLEVHAGWQSSRQLELEWNGVVSWHQCWDCELEARGSIPEDLLISFSLHIVLLLAAFMLPGHSIDPTDLLGSFNFKDDFLGLDGVRSHTEVDTSNDDLSGVVHWLLCLNHHIAVVVSATRVNVTHIIIRKDLFIRVFIYADLKLNDIFYYLRCKMS